MNLKFLYGLSFLEGTTTKDRSYMSANKLLKLVEIVGFEEKERVFDAIWW